MESRKELLAKSKRVVIKLGTAVLVEQGSGINVDRLRSFVRQVALLAKSGRELLLVSSGAIGLGRERLGLPNKPKLLPQKQACAAVGQSVLMGLYNEAFTAKGLTVAQLLLTEEDFSNRLRYLNLRSAISELLRFGVIPVINENDTVSTAEIESRKDSHIRPNFGDNDKLSALVAGKVDADLLIMLTDVDGLYTLNPESSPEAKLIQIVHEVTAEIEGLAQPTGVKKAGRGGMATKLTAAKIATHAGCAAIVAGGKVPNVISRIFDGEELGTLFMPQIGMRGKEKWIAFATTVRASLKVNDGAKNALADRKASLLPAGIVAVKGEFDRGDVVSVVDESGGEFARGIANYSSAETQKVLGMNSDMVDQMIEDRNYDAIITRDNLVLLDSKGAR